MRKGFTIVELLIVIVVVAILATIAIVAYSGIQNQAHETTVKSDLKNIGTVVMQEQILNGTGQPATADATGLTGKMKISKGSYNTSGITSGMFAYCRNNEEFALLARAKTNRTFMFRSTGGSVSIVANNGNITSLCTNASHGNISAASDGYAAVWILHPTAYSPDIWAPWVD